MIELIKLHQFTRVRTMADSDEVEVSEKRKLFIGALDFKTTDESLCHAFEKFGKVTSGNSAFKFGISDVVRKRL
jgi:hypothetical protein